MKRLELQHNIAEQLGRFACEVKASNAMGLLDINTVTEDILIPLLAEVFDCPALQNLNKIKMNHPAVDLGCLKSRISIGHI